MTLWSQYILAHSVAEAVQGLASSAGSARPVAGGTDLLLDLQAGSHAPIPTLVDLSAIPELKVLEVRGDDLFIGAGVPVSQVASSPLVIEHARALSEACGLIGGPQVRNSATLGGNVAHALPAADGTIALMALDARAEIAGPAGTRVVPLREIFKGVGQSTLASDEILTAFRLPLRQPGQASGFSRVMRPQGVALPILNLAAWLQRDGEELAAVRIAVGPAGPTPQRATGIEAFLAGKPYSPVVIAEAQVLVDTALRFRTSPARATAAYRFHLCKVLLAEVLEKAWQRSA